MVLLGETPAELRDLEASEVATEVMFQVAKVQSKYWKSIDVAGCEPPEGELTLRIILNTVTNIGDESTVIPIPGELWRLATLIIRPPQNTPRSSHVHKTQALSDPSR
jgi:hypothetical protein